MCTISVAAVKNQCLANPSALFPVLNVLRQAKSLTKEAIVWRPRAAIAQPKFCLRIAAHAFTQSLHLPVQEITGSLLVLRKMDLAPLLNSLSSWNCQLIGNGPFNNTTPHIVIRHMQESVKWLAHRK